jgi:hypothetical protein
MSEQDKKLTPEEKLLKVIQGGGKDDPKAAPQEPPKVQPPQPQQHVPPRLVPPAPKAAQPSATRPPSPAKPAPASGAAAPSPSPSAVEPPRAGQVSSASVASAPAAAAAPQPPAAPPPAASKQAKPARPAPSVPAAAAPALSNCRSPALTSLNRFLAVATAAMVAVSGWELWASCMGKPRSIPAPGESGLSRGVSPLVATPSEPCAAATDAFSKKPLFAQVGDPPPVPPGPTNLPQPEVVKNLDLIGLSRGVEGQPDEAIVVDRATKKNYFVKVGETLTIGQMQLELLSVADDHAVFRSGKGEIRLQ